MLSSTRKIYNNKNRLRRIGRLMKSYRNEYKRKRMHEWLYNGVKYERVRGVTALPSVASSASGGQQRPAAVTVTDLQLA